MRGFVLRSINLVVDTMNFSTKLFRQHEAMPES